MALLDGDRDEASLLADGLQEDFARVMADRQSLSGQTSQQRLDHERDLDELFAHTDALLGTFDEKLLD